MTGKQICKRLLAGLIVVAVVQETMGLSPTLGGARGNVKVCQTTHIKVGYDAARVGGAAAQQIGITQGTRRMRLSGRVGSDWRRVQQGQCVQQVG